MKTKIFIILLLSLVMLGCSKGTSRIKLHGDEETLPAELRGLRVYNVSTGGLGEVKVAILNGQVNSVTYPVGKTTQTTIIVNKDHYNERVIEAKEILSENDSIIVIRK